MIVEYLIVQDKILKLPLQPCLHIAPAILVFESNKIAIIINNAVVVTDKLGGPRLCYHITGAPPLKKDLLHKNAKQVHWITSLDQYLKTVPSGKVTNIIKLQHGWQQTATSSRNKLIMYHEDDDDEENSREDGICPLDCGCEEIQFTT